MGKLIPYSFCNAKATFSFCKSDFSDLQKGQPVSANTSISKRLCTLLLAFLCSYISINEIYAQTTSNICPATTVNLMTKIDSTSKPVGTVVTWHTSTPATALNRVPDPTSVGAGTYYAAYYDVLVKCFGTTIGPLAVTIVPCTPLNFFNICPATTVDLTSHVDSTDKPVGSFVSWHTDTPATGLNRVLNPTAVSVSRAYYVAYFDPATNCYGATSVAGNVTITSCLGLINLTNTCPAATADLTSHVDSTAKPAGVFVSWHKGTPPATAANKVANPAAVSLAGDYFVVYYDPATVCYGTSFGKVTVSITACNQPPIAQNDIAVTPSGKPVSGNVLTNDKDPEGGVLTVSTTPTTPPSKGSVVLNPDGSYTYTPTPGAVGEDKFCYKVCDVSGKCDTACVVIEILPAVTPDPLANDKPIAIDDNTQTYPSTPVVVKVLANDLDPDGKNTLGKPTLIASTTPKGGTMVVNADSSISYTPAAGFIGTDSFDYIVCDKGLPTKCDTAKVTIEVLPTPPAGNKPPVAIDDANLTVKNTAVSGTVSGNDSDPDAGQSLSFTPIGTLPVSQGVLTLSGTGGYVFTPAAGFVGSISQLYKVCDNGSPILCDTATLVIAITDPANQKVCLLPKAYLQGSLFGIYMPDTLMRDDLRVKGFIPTTSPYPAMGMTGITITNAATTAVIGASSPSGANAIVDWVFVELRSGADSTLVVDSRSALIQRDGDIVDVDGVSSVKFSQANAGDYYVVVRHRNHLGVMSVKTPMSATCTVIDFRRASTPTFNLDATNPVNQSQVVVEQGRALWAGNALYVNTNDGKHSVIFQGTDNDVNVVYQQVINAATNIFISPFYKFKGYYAGDINMNGEVIFQGTTNDVEFIYQNIIKNHPGNLLVQPFFKIREQIP
jgi:Bacterial Ig domain